MIRSRIFPATSELLARCCPYAVGASMLLLTACTSATPPGPSVVAAPPPETTTCDATGALSFIGQLASPEVIGSAMQAAHATEVQVLAKDAGATPDFRQGRLNILLDAGRITELRCG